MSKKRGAAALFLVLILLAEGPTAGDRQLLGIVLLAATTAVAIEALRRQTLREFPEDPRPARLTYGGPGPPASK
jgi:hypothetical protein